MSIDPALLTDCRELALGIVPELKRVPFYLTMSPPGYPAAPGCFAFCPLLGDWNIREHLKQAGEWRGPGSMIVLHDNLPDDPDCVRGIVLHELGHAVPIPDRYQPDREPTTHERVVHSKMLQLWEADGAPTDLDRPWHPWHEWKFIRYCIHLRWRALQLGVEVPAPCLHAAGERYELSHINKYIAALGDEPARLSAGSFATIYRTDPPPEFTAIFESDVAYYKTLLERMKNEHFS